jgi:hypothetical protein
VAILSQCPFLSSIEEKIQCFAECSFYEYEGRGEGCPFKKIKTGKSFNIKELLSLDVDRKVNDYDAEFDFSEEFI